VRRSESARRALPARIAVTVSLAVGALATAGGALAIAPTVATAPLAAAPAAAPPVTPAAAPPPVAPDVGSYDLGLVIGGQLANSGLVGTLSREELVRGIEAALEGKLATPQQKDDAQRFSHGARDTLAARNAGAAHDFLEKNAHEKGVRILPSGLQYRVLAAGDPKAALPGPMDQITVRYRASLTDGTEIDNSDSHGQTPVFRLNSVIKGWHEALSAMRPGDRWQVFVPPELGYGANSPPPIPPGSLLIYELELLKVEVPASEAAPTKPAAPRSLPHPRNPEPIAPRWPVPRGPHGTRGRVHPASPVHRCAASSPSVRAGSA